MMWLDVIIVIIISDSGIFLGTCWVVQSGNDDVSSKTSKQNDHNGSNAAVIIKCSNTMNFLKWKFMVVGVHSKGLFLPVDSAQCVFLLLLLPG